MQEKNHILIEWVLIVYAYVDVFNRCICTSVNIS